MGLVLTNPHIIGYIYTVNLSSPSGYIKIASNPRQVQTHVPDCCQSPPELVRAVRVSSRNNPQNKAAVPARQGTFVSVSDVVDTVAILLLPPDRPPISLQLSPRPVWVEVVMWTALTDLDCEGVAL
jgi:hypothetical protein